MIGYIAVITVTFLSGFSVVYFEKILKTSTVDIWYRNVQLSKKIFVTKNKEKNNSNFNNKVHLVFFLH
jgi:hypothetical protein